MRLLLGTLALLLVLSGCGAGDSSADVVPVEDQPVASPAVLVSGTAAGGRVADRWTELPGRAAVTAYADRFRGPLPGDLVEAAGTVDLAEGEVLVAQVVAVGCDVPPAASTGDGTFVAQEAPAPLPECFAPVTTVALAAVPG